MSGNAWRALLGVSAYQLSLLDPEHPLSPAQGAMLKSIYGEPLLREELKSWREATGTIVAKPNPKGYDEAWACLGRQSGKSKALSPLMIVAEVLKPHSLARGQFAKISVFAPKLEMTTEIIDAVEGLLQARCIPHKRTQYEILVDSMRVVVEATTADHSLRGATRKLAIGEEFASIPVESWAVDNAESCLTAVRPSLLILRGKLIIFSTPFGMRGPFWEAFKAHHGKTSGSTLFFKLPTWKVNPLVTEEDTRRVEPNEAARLREFGCEFSANEQGFLRQEDVQSCVDDVQERPPVKGVKYVIGFDLGIRRDSTAIVVCHREARDVDGGPPVDVIVTDCVRVFSPRPPERLDFDAVIVALANLAVRYNDATVLRDSFSGDAVHAALKIRGVRSDELAMGSKAQAERFEFLAQKIRNGTLRLVDHPVLVRELIDLRMTLHSLGRVEIAAPNRNNAHDDAADALALAAFGARKLEASGNVRRNTSASFVGGALRVTTQYFSERVDGLGVSVFEPRMPPRGTAEWRRAKLERNSQGVFVAEDFEDDGEDGGISVPVKY